MRVLNITTLLAAALPSANRQSFKLELAAARTNNKSIGFRTEYNSNKF